MSTRWSVTVYQVRSASRAATQYRPTAAYSPKSTNMPPHTMKNGGAFLNDSTLPSQNSAKPSHSSVKTNTNGEPRNV